MGRRRPKVAALCGTLAVWHTRTSAHKTRPLARCPVRVAIRGNGVVLCPESLLKLCFPWFSLQLWKVPMQANLAPGSKPTANMACCTSAFEGCVTAGRDPPRPYRNPWDWFRHLVVAFTGVCAVTPLTNVTPASLKYQLYLNTIFHRTPVSFYGHATTMPMVNFFILVLMSFCEFRASSNGEKSFGDLSIVCAGVLWLW